MSVSYKTEQYTFTFKELRNCSILKKYMRQEIVVFASLPLAWDESNLTHENIFSWTVLHTRTNRIFYDIKANRLFCFLFSSRNTFLYSTIHCSVLQNSPTTNNVRGIRTISAPLYPLCTPTCLYPHQHCQRIDQLFVLSPPYWNRSPY